MAKAKKQRAPVEKIEVRPLASLTPYVRNPRLHSPEQVEQIAASMTEFGQTQLVVVDEHGEIIAGHGRVMAAQQLGWSEVSVGVAVGWTEQQKKAYRIADNQIALSSSWDESLLSAELIDLKGSEFDLSLLGFTSDQVLGLLTSETDKDEEVMPPVPAHAVSVKGDLWVLGGHRLLCGDSTISDDVTRLMAGERAALFATDPPYAVGYRGGEHPSSTANKSNPKRNKNWEQVYHEADGDGSEFYDAFISKAVAHAIEPNAAWYCWHSSIRAPMVEQAWNRAGAFSHQQIIWVKSRPVLTYSVYLWQHEPCIMGWVRGQKPSARRSGTTVPNEFNTTVWTIPNSEIESDEHPTSKPTKIFEVPMLVHTKRGGLCYEPFSGSGSQIIAAERRARRCFAMEISPAFVDVGVLRWENLTKQKAVLEPSGKTFEQVKAERTKAPKRAPSRKLVV